MNEQQIKAFSDSGLIKSYLYPSKNNLSGLINLLPRLTERTIILMETEYSDHTLMYDEGMIFYAHCLEDNIIEEDLNNPFTIDLVSQEATYTVIGQWKGEIE